MVHKPHVGFLKTLDKLDLAALACLSPNFLLIAMAVIFGFLENRVFNLHSSLKSLKGHRGHKLPGPPEERPRLFFLVLLDLVDLVDLVHVVPSFTWFTFLRN